MKTQIFALMTVSLLTAAFVAPQYALGVTQSVLSDSDFKEALKKIENGNTAMAGQARLGSVVFSGITAAEKNQQLTVDNHLTVGTPSDLVMIRSLGQEELKVMNQVIERKTFINLGCGNQIPANEIAGLIPSKARIQNGFIHAHAHKVFLCGNGIVGQKNAIVYANELIMKNSNVTFPKSGGIINICAKTMTLNGDNQLLSIDKSHTTPGAPVFLTVLEKIQGTGTLTIN